MSTKFYQLQLDQSLVNCGMSYVFQLENGDFFIIDGGYFTPGEEENLYNFLRSKTLFKPHIRGWLFTHAHQDHIGCYLKFIEKYQNDVTIDTLYFNFQPTKHKFAFGSWQKKSNDLATVKYFYKSLKVFSDLYQVHTLKTGEQISIDELKINVLYTQEDLYPEKASFNDYSAVISVELAGKKILFLGDVQEKGSAILLRDKKEELKADIVQVSHHGFNGATKELYEATGAKTALFPCPLNEFEKNKERPANAYIIASADEIIISENGTACLEFDNE